MKTVFSMAIAACCFLPFTFATTVWAATPEEVPVEEHQWDEGVVTAEPTCSSPGEKTFTCTDCGATRTEIIEETGIHLYDGGSVAKEPNCLENGEMVYYCVYDCGSFYTKEIPATGHQYDDGVITKAATETETGIRTYTCTRCGENYTETIPTAQPQQTGGNSGKTDDPAPSSARQISIPHTGNSAVSIAVPAVLSLISGMGIGLAATKRKRLR